MINMEANKTYKKAKNKATLVYLSPDNRKKVEELSKREKVSITRIINVLVERAY